MKYAIKRIPFLGSIIVYIYRKWINPLAPFISSEKYWVNRYNMGENSDQGSYGHLADFKADIINEFVRRNVITSVIELGCGEGNQLKLAEYPSYTGFDVSLKALSICEEAFSNDTTKNFRLMENYNNETADLSLSLDVIFHLVEDYVFTEYMNTLFSASKKFVIIYSSDYEENIKEQPSHVKHRNFSLWINKKMPGWKLSKYIPNQYLFKGNTRTDSFCDFFIYEKV